MRAKSRLQLKPKEGVRSCKMCIGVTNKQIEISFRDMIVKRILIWVNLSLSLMTNSRKVGFCIRPKTELKRNNSTNDMVQGEL